MRSPSIVSRPSSRHAVPGGSSRSAVIHGTGHRPTAMTTTTAKPGQRTSGGPVRQRTSLHATNGRAGSVTRYRGGTHGSWACTSLAMRIAASPEQGAGDHSRPRCYVPAPGCPPHSGGHRRSAPCAEVGSSARR